MHRRPYLWIVVFLILWAGYAVSVKAGGYEGVKDEYQRLYAVFLLEG